ncbi:MAG: prc [Gammaproteobacteria bacterium]|jgi:carboxyl-terminal processing protease|nr:prc [Gammaproteobacteria bacterium]
MIKKTFGVILVILLSHAALATPAAPSSTGSSQLSPEKTASIDLPIDDIQQFTTVLGEIKHYYVKDVTDKALFENAIRGMLSGLDPHSTYLDENDLSDLETNTKGQFGGLGVEIGMENGLIKVISPIDDTPAKRAGLQAGDYILRLNETPVNGMDLTEVVKKMRGEKGSSLTLTIYRKSEKKPFQVKITRDIIKVNSVKSRVLDKEYGYLRISEFQEPSAALLKESITKIMKNNKMPVKGWILDLRDNPGGLLNAAVQISDMFLDTKTMGKNLAIVSTKGRIPGSTFIEEATPGDILNHAPLVVLVNEGSASASEIVSGALQDHGRALIVGNQTFGKGSVQTILPVDEKTAIKLTTSLYYTPSGRSIQAEGIKPDINITMLDISEQNEDDKLTIIREAELTGHLDNQQDKQTQKAKGENTAVNNATDSSQLLHEDYQLYQALNMLKSMGAIHTMQAKSQLQ